MCLPPAPADRLAGVRPQEQVQRHTVEQMGGCVPGLPVVGAPVPQVEQLEQLVVVPHDSRR